MVDKFIKCSITGWEFEIDRDVFIKQALLCVNEILEQGQSDSSFHINRNHLSDLEFWKQVEQEIKEL